MSKVTLPGNFLDIAFDNYLNKFLDGQSAQWRERNAGTVISGSNFAACPRLVWYQHFDERAGTVDASEQWELPDKKRMFLGHKSEEFNIEALRMAQVEGLIPGTVFVSQTEPPVNLKRQYKDKIFGSTTDLVYQYDGKDFGKETRRITIPIELKQTDRPAQAWWKRSKDKVIYREFERKPEHERQLIHWINNADACGEYFVPYGLLKYFRRIDYDTITWVYYRQQFEKQIYKLFAKQIDEDDINYVFIEMEPLKEDMLRRMDDHILHTDTNVLPAFPEDVPRYKCDSCPYQSKCWENV